MPITDPERRRKVTKEWRESRSTEYSKWLYARRKLRFDIAESGRELLEKIARGLPYDARNAASEWLAEIEKREREVGNNFDHERNVAWWQESL